MSSTSPLSALRHWLEASHLDGMIVPRADAWQSEYCAPYDEKLAWLTGFDGSAGVALVLKNKALPIAIKLGLHHTQINCKIGKNALILYRCIKP